MSWAFLVMPQQRKSRQRRRRSLRQSTPTGISLGSSYSSASTRRMRYFLIRWLRPPRASGTASYRRKETSSRNKEFKRETGQKRRVMLMETKIPNLHHLRDLQQHCWQGFLRSKNYYSRNVIKCFNKSCDTPHTTMTWREASKFINAQIDNLTTTHECGKRVDNEELKKHLLICQKLIIGCFKCKGIGKYSMVEGTEIQFNSCYGRKVLQGVDWRECFKSCC